MFRYALKRLLVLFGSVGLMAVTRWVGSDADNATLAACAGVVFLISQIDMSEFKRIYEQRKQREQHIENLMKGRRW